MSSSLPIRIGVRAHDFGCLPAGELAAKIAANHLVCAQLALGKAIAGLDLKPGVLTPGLAFEIGEAFQ
ncbi:MAG TPA: sugar phosphate isomerase/epimerase, partial [bacterium]